MNRIRNPEQDAQTNNNAAAPISPGQGFREQLLPTGARGPVRRPVAIPAPSEEAIVQLLALGFERELVVRALMESNNNVEAAANRLLS